MVSAGAAATAGAAVTALRVIVVIVIAGWILLFAVLIGTLVLMVVLRGRRQREQQRRGAAPSATADPGLPARLAEVRAGDPHFDEQLLLGAAQMVCLVLFAAMSTGDERAIRRLADSSFWSTFFGRYLQNAARGARLRRRTAEARGRASRQAQLPVDYQASAPELIGLEPGRKQRAVVRVSFSQLRAAVGAGAQGQAAGASAASLTSLATSLGGAMGERMNGAAELSWVSWAGGTTSGSAARPVPGQTRVPRSPAASAPPAARPTRRS